MLPTELLAVQRWKDQVRPKYSKLSQRDVSAAEAIIRLYEGNVGVKRGAIREKVGELENAYGDYRLVRGLAALVERACVFTSNFHADPLKVRHMLFVEAAKKGFAASTQEREAIVREVASALGLSPSQVEESMYADLDAESVLQSCPNVKPTELLKQYNLSLTQTLLFSSTEMEFTASGNWQRIFRAVKFHGLMYTAARREGSVHVRLDGPTSLFKLTRRYGTALAKVVPEIMRGKPWMVQAKILRANRLLNFVLESGRHGWLFPKLELAEKYDSAVEKEFAEQFRSLRTEWEVRREPEPVEAGSAIMIPDFAFNFGKRKVYMEVVGFWTREYLKRKVEKLSEVRDHFIVAVDEELACDRLERLQASNPNIRLLYYKGEIPVREVFAYLQPLAEAEVEVQASELRMAVRKPVATVRELAEAYGISEEAVRRAACKVETHVLIGEELLEKGLLEKVKRTLVQAVTGEVPLVKAVEALKPCGISDPITTMAALGYRVKWRGLSIESATVSPPTNTSQASPS
jgi:predicted nuclease of restriction endonuclease-like RecB superfamily